MPSQALARVQVAVVTVPPMLFVMSTTLSAGTIMISNGQLTSYNLVLVLFVIASIVTLVLMAMIRCLRVALGK